MDQAGSKLTREITVMNLKNAILSLVRDEQGQDLIEYALLATFVSLVAIVGATALGTALNGWYDSVATEVDTAAGGVGN
jgi:pilus assembly protein Flp/PilA